MRAVQDGERGARVDLLNAQRRNLRGYCKENCGACCTYLKLNVHPEYWTNSDARHWVELHGITLTERAGQVWVTIPLPCSALQPDKSCGLYGTDERPRLCSAWPFEQNEIDEVDKRGANCTFYFEESEI